MINSRAQGTSQKLEATGRVGLKSTKPTGTSDQTKYVPNKPGATNGIIIIGK